MNAKETVLVTGGSGFIGTNLISRLLELDFKVFNLDYEVPQNSDHLKYHIECDIRDKDDVTRIFEKIQPDYVVHLAARTDLRGETIEEYSSNTVGVENVCLNIANSKNIIKTVFASSMLVCERGYIPTDNLDFSPNTVYGESKVKSEKIVNSYSDVLGDFAIVRPTSIWGPWFRTPYRDFFDLVLSKKYFHIVNSNTKKTYGYVGNSVNQIISILKSKENFENHVIYIGDSIPLNIREWANSIAIESRLDRPKSIPYFIFFLAALVGNVLGWLGISFPMTTFRLNNMTNDNVQDCEIAERTNVFEKITTQEGILETLCWIKSKRVE
ncbi:NAD(P)-dependent oxidoreductase [Vibrio fluvialis]|nr:NAD(P)-dependent oxidoreductase [Vibrio fluvialis]